MNRAQVCMLPRRESKGKYSARNLCDVLKQPITILCVKILLLNCGHLTNKNMKAVTKMSRAQEL